MITPDGKGVKKDEGKLRYDLLPPRPLEELVRVYGIGAAKYGDYNYLRGMKWGRVISALYRHMEAWRRGEERDQVDGQLHLSSVAWCAFTLMEYVFRGIGEDDRQIESVSNVGNTPEELNNILRKAPFIDHKNRIVTLDRSACCKPWRLDQMPALYHTVYLAAPWQWRAEMIQVKEHLEVSGNVIVNSTWLGPEDTDDLATLANEEDRCRKVAQRDFDEIDAADVVVVFSYPEMHGKGSGGRHVELGYALAKGKPVVLVGEKENVFHRLGSIRQVDAYKDLPRVIEEIMGQTNAAKTAQAPLGAA